MLIDSVVCSKIDKIDLTGFDIDFVEIEWYEVSKRILHKVSSKGVEVGIKLSGDKVLKHRDVLHLEGNSALMVQIPECDCIALKPQNLSAMGKACYEIGNRHSPLFYQEDRLLMPYDPPLLEALKKCGFEAYKCSARLITTLGTIHHGHSHHDHSHHHDHAHEHVHSKEQRGQQLQLNPEKYHQVNELQHLQI